MARKEELVFARAEGKRINTFVDPKVGEERGLPMTIQRNSSWWVLGTAVALCSACSSHPPNHEHEESTPDHVKVVVGNSGPEDLYDVKVILGKEELKLGNFGPGLEASTKFFPKAGQIGKRVTIIVQYEDEKEKLVRLKGSKAFKVFPKGEIRLQIRNGGWLAEIISKQ
jgi:hypothetical protein